MKDPIVGCLAGDQRIEGIDPSDLTDRFRSPLFEDAVDGSGTTPDPIDELLHFLVLELVDDRTTLYGPDVILSDIIEEIDERSRIPFKILILRGGKKRE